MRMLTPFISNNGRNLNADLFDEIERFMDDWSRIVASPARVYDERSFHPACEVSESDDHYLMSVDLPGMRAEDIKIEMSEKLLTLSGERKKELSEKNSRTQRHEKTYGFFKRTFNLPATIENEKVEARYEDGVLELYLPKTQVARPRKIEIKSGNQGLFSRLIGHSKDSSEAKPKEIASKVF